MTPVEKEAARESLEDLLGERENAAFQTVFKVQLENLLAQVLSP